MTEVVPFAFDQVFLDELTARAKASERHRAHYDLRDSVEDDSMRMLNAIEPQTVIPVHRHAATSEDVVVLRGVAEEVLYDSSGIETSRVRMEPGTGCIACHVPRGCYHTCKSLASGTVIIEFKNTRYDPIGTEELLER